MLNKMDILKQYKKYAGNILKWFKNENENNLVVLRFFAFDIHKPRFVKFVVRVSIAFIYLLVVLHIVLYIWVYPITSDEKYSYLVWISTLLSMAFCQHTLLNLSLSISKLCKDFAPEQISKCSVETRNKIKKESKYIELSAIAIVSLGLLTAAYWGIHGEHDNNMILVYRFVEEYLPKIAIPLQIFKEIILIPLFSSIVVVPFQMHYCVYQAKFQIYVLIDKIKDISKELPTKGDNLSDSHYHTNIKNKLKANSEHHLKIIQFVKKVSQAFGNGLLVLLPIGVSITIGVIMCIIKGIMSYKNSRLGIGSIFFSSIFISLLYSGQSVETEGELIFQALVMTEWYKWNTENRKTLLMILTNAKIIRMQYFIVQFNYTLAVSIVRTIYSTVSMLVNIM